MGPLAGVHGASNKVLNMSLSNLLIACNGIGQLGSKSAAA